MSAASLTVLRTDASTGCTARTTVRVSWVTVVVCASVIAYIDGFWTTSLHGAVGPVDSTQGPFLRWLCDSTLMLPTFVLAVLAALTLARRLVGRSRREAVSLATAAMLMVVLVAWVLALRGGRLWAEAVRCPDRVSAARPG